MPAEPIKQNKIPRIVTQRISQGFNIRCDLENVVILCATRMNTSAPMPKENEKTLNHDIYILRTIQS